MLTLGVSFGLRRDRKLAREWQAKFLAGLAESESEQDGLGDGLSAAESQQNQIHRGKPSAADVRLPINKTPRKFSSSGGGNPESPRSMDSDGSAVSIGGGRRAAL